MKIIIKRLFDNSKNEKGAILTALVGQATKIYKTQSITN
jgi:hypothetical protein